MKDVYRWLLVCGCWVPLVSPEITLGADAKPTIKDVMTAAHKKPRELLKKVATGAATDSEKAELVKLYQALAVLAPPRGEAASWEEKTKLLLVAAKAAAEGKPEAGEELARVANCAACHQTHK